VVSDRIATAKVMKVRTLADAMVDTVREPFFTGSGTQRWFRANDNLSLALRRLPVKPDWNGIGATISQGTEELDCFLERKVERVVDGIKLRQSGRVVGQLILSRAGALAQGKAFPDG
jgi:hypothetical protein